ncbi:hypothetical protein EDD15DRAFT_2334591 [Pisolithus albus]|nr:hypothetical protein EDD15DRAFT_2334591 [Pisolithus albus]
MMFCASWFAPLVMRFLHILTLHARRQLSLYLRIYLSLLRARIRTLKSSFSDSQNLHKCAMGFAHGLTGRSNANTRWKRQLEEHGRSSRCL